MTEETLQDANAILREQLHRGEVEVVFTKRDGTERTMICTLKEGVVVPHEKTTDRVKQPNADTLAVWDVEKAAWRSFKISTIKTFKAL